MKDPLTQRMVFLTGLLVLAGVAGALLSPHFLQGSTVGYLLQYVPVLGVLGMAQTLVMLSGGPGIDLSVGATMSLVGLAIAAMFGAGVPLLLACAVGLVIGGLLGAVNAVLVCVLKVPSLMGTLATFFAYSGLALALTGGAPIGGIPDWFAGLAQGRFLGIPVHMWVVFVPLAVVLHVMLSRTRIGSHIYAAGNDERAAFLSGVKVWRLRFGLYCLSGVIAGLAAIMTLSWFQAARPDAGEGMELLSVTVAVLGGAHIFGGIGRISGTVLAVLIVTTLQVALQLANISQAWQLAAIGVLLIGSVMADNAVGDRLRAAARRAAS
ncbi:ABC transporter permease [Palleronia pelagia]|uniref:Ribose transport system permease protein n=1 Tax=Palleronia pelagia TaxID=387096 RepID=A0A1H8DCU6_9RHOB|nr:ABC transporter permease [Palleronia pelagia]SEN05191.1 ribose transport system permease protein [Palleronia pelagia]